MPMKCLVEKAEMVMQERKDIGFARRTIYCNIMMNLYYLVGNREKIDALMREMEAKGINGDQFTLGIRLSAYAAAASDFDGMDKIINMTESNPQMGLDFNLLAVAVHGYLKVDRVDKAMTMLKKSEGRIATKRNSSNGFELVLKNYAEAGRKDQLYRIWKHYGQTRKGFNKGYMTMMGLLLKLDDVKGAEKTLRNWTSKNLPYASSLIDDIAKMVF